MTCPCKCFECSVDRHDICRHLIKCIRRPIGTFLVDEDDPVPADIAGNPTGEFDGEF